MLALTPSERRGALVFVLLLLIGAGRDLWRASRAPRAPAAPESSRAERWVPSPDAPPAGPGGDGAPGDEPSDGARGAAGRGAASASGHAGENAGAPAVRPVPRPRRLVDLNRADARELETLPGVGPVLAARIVLQRRRDGPFRELEDLLAVRGVGSRLLERIRPYAGLGVVPDAAATAAAPLRDSTARATR